MRHRSLSKVSKVDVEVAVLLSDWALELQGENLEPVGIEILAVQWTGHISIMDFLFAPVGLFTMSRMFVREVKTPRSDNPVRLRDKLREHKEHKVLCARTEQG